MYCNGRHERLYGLSVDSRESLNGINQNDSVAVDLDAKLVNWLQATKPVDHQDKNIKPDKELSIILIPKGICSKHACCIHLKNVDSPCAAIVGVYNAVGRPEVNPLPESRACSDQGNVDIPVCYPNNPGGTFSCIISH